MEFSRSEYPGLLATLEPGQAVAVLNNRVALISKINTDIADWLQERRRVEEAYVAALRRLARRPQQDGAAALGIFQMPWQRIVSGTENLAAAHETLATKILSDVETPLRSFATRNREMQALGTTQGNLAAIARDLEAAQKKVAKGGKKADSASSTADDVARQWDSQAPYVFEQLQAIDETRINHLRDVLTQFQTHEVDSIERGRASAESCLNALLNVETADEIKTFAARQAGGRSSMARRRSSATASARPASAHVRIPPAPPPHRQTDDGLQPTPSSTTDQDRLAPLPDATPHKEKGKLGGLKRLGTVMGRRKSNAPPVPQRSFEEKRKTRSFVPFRRGDSSQSFQDLEESGQDLTPSTSRDRPVSAIVPESRREQPHEPSQPVQPPLATLSTLTNGTNASDWPPSHHATAPSQPTSADAISATQPSGPSAPATSSIPERIPMSGDSTTQPPPLAGITPPAVDDSSRNFMIREKPIQEDESEAQQAMNIMASQLRTQAQASGMTRVQGSVRGRRDVRNTVYYPNAAEPLGSGVAASPVASPAPVAAGPSGGDDAFASPLPRPMAHSVPLDDHGAASETTSIHSARSLATPSQHPDLHVPGLNASIIETVHATFTESGISKSLVLGEVAFAYNSTASEHDQTTVRLQHFELLDKVAVNPIFLSQAKPTADSTTEEQAGTYSLATAPIRRPTPMVGLKYQLHLEDHNMARYSPVLITPAWQIVEGQVSVILLYSLNPGFGPEPLTLQNVSITVNLDTSGVGTGRATSAMMAPTQGASFRRKTSAVMWRFNELAVKPDQERLLVRFMTQGGMPKKGAIELKFEVANQLASGIGVEKMASATPEKDTDPFADDTGESSAKGTAEGKAWEAVPTKSKLLSGRYTAS